MRQLRLLLPLFILISLAGNIMAQADCDLNIAYVCEDFDNYDDTMPLGPQSAVWTTWSGTEGGAEDGDVSTDQAASGSNSLSITGGVGGGPQDVVLLFGDQTTGRYHVQFKMYIPAGFGGYYNVQKFETPGTEFAHQVIFDPSGVAQLDAGMQSAASVDFPHDAWFVIDQVIDIDNDWTTLSIDGRQVYSWPYSHEAIATGGSLSLGGFDFYALDETYAFYVDDIIVEAQPDCSLDAESIICDDMEAYAGSSTVGPNSSWWTTWSLADGGSEDGTVSDEQASSGDYSMKISEGQAQDVILLLGDKQAGSYTLQWMQYVPAGATAYYNIQEDQVPAVAWNMDVFFNNGGGSPGTGVVDQTGATFDYPEDSWFMVRQIIDTDEGGLALYIDGNLVDGSLDYTDLHIGSIDFFSIDASNIYYIDDVVYKASVDCATLDPITATGTATDANAGAMDGTAMVEVAGGIGNYTYSWDTGDDTPSISGLAPGDYTCIISPNASFGGCLEDATVTVTVGELVGTTELEILESLSVVPNPTSGNVLLELNMTEAAEVQLQLQDLSGKILAVENSQNNANPRYELDMSQYSNGIYIARFTIGSEVVVRKIVLNK
ncbi:MAG: T9SS type A sorting domain-containing protein [Bacteroidetes bacterium]|nr:T9SS type A sorting domain-containing protein [Bacteroidota bacterium]